MTRARMPARWIAAATAAGAAIACGRGSSVPPRPPPKPIAWNTPAPAAAGTAQETVIGRLETDAALPFVFSPRGDRAGARVQVSNEPGYGQPSVIVGEYVVMVSAAGARQSEQHRLVSAPIFSPDGGRFVYLAAATDREVYVVTDAGREGPYADVSYPSFSARGHLAFTVRKPGEDPEWLVVDGRWGPAREQVEHPQFSPDGARVVYATTRGRDWHVVVDDELGPAFEQVGVVRFSADGARISYGARRRGRPVVVVDGAVRELPAGAEAVVLGPSFDRILHQTAAGGVRTLHLDGRAVASWDDVSSGGAPVFAADGASFAYVEWRGGTCAAVVADARGRRLREGRRFQTIQQLYFAPRGDALAYAGCEADGCRVMWGDREGPRFTGTSEPVFSPDGRTIAYLAGGPQGTLVMVGEQSYGPYPLVAPPVFSSDGRQVAWGIQRGRELRWVVVAVAAEPDPGP